MTTQKPVKQSRKYTLQELIDLLPENTPLYRDSGLWQLRTDDMSEVIHQQNVCETFHEFLIRCFELY